MAVSQLDSCALLPFSAGQLTPMQAIEARHAVRSYIDEPLAPEALARLEALPCVNRASYADGELRVDCAPAAHALVDVLEELRAAGVSCGRVWSEPPTLNDVFLELCGRELRD